MNNEFVVEVPNSVTNPKIIKEFTVRPTLMAALTARDLQLSANL